MLKEGMKAPDFRLKDQNSNLISLKDYRGENIVLYFYPKDNTSGCTKEACAFRDDLSELKKVKAAVLGVSADSVASHKSFADKFKLPFSLLSDEQKEVIQKYGVWVEKSMYGKKYMGIERATFIIDGNGVIQKIFKKVKVSNHSKEVLEALSKLK